MATYNNDCFIDVIIAQGCQGKQGSSVAYVQSMFTHWILRCTGTMRTCGNGMYIDIGFSFYTLLELFIMSYFVTST